MTPLDFYQNLYYRKLRDAGVPVDPARRTPAQQQVAAMVFFAANLEIASLVSVTQAGLEAV